jgi:hypothetical protein
MKKSVFALCASLGLLGACITDSGGTQGGANANDRTSGGEQGERLLTGAMSTSPDGRYVVIQRNETTVLLNVASKQSQELPLVVDRVVFPDVGGDVGYVVTKAPISVVAFDFAKFAKVWQVTPAFLSDRAALLAKLSEDGTRLLLGDIGRVFVIDTARGTLLDALTLGTDPTDVAIVPGKNRALIAGTVSWPLHKPSTKVFQLDLRTLELTSVNVPNCHAPMEVLPDATRAFMSPTFCEEGKATRPANWTNPDPVSVLDLGAGAPQFVRNLPGFGPVAMAKDGSRLIAYLDRARVDESLFDDPAQVPRGTATQFQLMTIEPKSLTFKLAPIGQGLPRFALTKDGNSLLVDASSLATRTAQGSIKATLSKDGLRVDTALFGNAAGEASVFGRFDLQTQRYAAFAGPPARLDRFVQTADGKRVFTLTATDDGLGGDLSQIDLAAGTTTMAGCALRDVGLLGDGNTLLLRVRLAASKRPNTTGGFDWYRREAYCFSADGTACSTIVRFQDSKPFASGTQSCPESHDCLEMVPPVGAICKALDLSAVTP